MAYTAGNLFPLGNAPPGRHLYRYDTEDQNDVVETGGYFNNVDDNLNLQIGDMIFSFTWSATPFAAGSTLSEFKMFAVTNVISNDAATLAGAVNIAEIGLGTGLLSSGD
jgi:hypothetical protein